MKPILLGILVVILSMFIIGTKCEPSLSKKITYSILIFLSHYTINYVKQLCNLQMGQFSILEYIAPCVMLLNLILVYNSNDDTLNGVHESDSYTRGAASVLVSSLFAVGAVMQVIREDTKFKSGAARCSLIAILLSLFAAIPFQESHHAHKCIGLVMSMYRHGAVIIAYNLIVLSAFAEIRAFKINES